MNTAIWVILYRYRIENATAFIITGPVRYDKAISLLEQNSSISY